MNFHIPLKPVGFKRPRPSKSGRYYSPHSKELVDWQGLFKNQMKVKGEKIIEGPVSVHMIFAGDEVQVSVRPVVGQDSNRPKGVRADIDNLVKFVLDALEGYAYFNDRQVVDIDATFRHTT
jgi:Holliday junction resolvase RusA-like endonuclease